VDLRVIWEGSKQVGKHLEIKHGCYGSLIVVEILSRLDGHF